MATQAHSADLQWLLVRNNNKFYQLRNNIRLTSDPLANGSAYTKGNAAFLQSKGANVRLQAGKGGKVNVTIKDAAAENANKPRKMYTKKSFDAGVKASVVAKAVTAVAANQSDVAFRRARRVAVIASRTTKARTATKALSAKRQFRRKATKKTGKK